MSASNEVRVSRTIEFRQKVVVCGRFGHHMKTYKISTVVKEDGTVTTEDLTFGEGEELDVVLFSREEGGIREAEYPLRGEIVKYTVPFGSIAEDYWDSLK
ncbi:hypothetical protein BH24ACT22_BH24ACT22_06700 [soil metagenome]